MRADLQIHSIYSSHGLYMKNKKLMKKLFQIYPKSSFSEEDPWWMEYVLIDGVCSPREILVEAKRKNMDAIAITDHNTFIGSLEAQKLSYEFDILVIPGMEISTLEGEILAYGIKEKIPMRLSAIDTIGLIHQQGGVAVASHPFTTKHNNQDFARLDKTSIEKLNLDGVEVFSPIFGLQGQWVEIARKNNLSQIGGSDAHSKASIGSVWTEFPKNCKNTNDILKAIKTRITYADGYKNRITVLLKTALEYSWKNTIGRPFIKTTFYRTN